MEEKREHQISSTGEDAEIRTEDKREGGEGTAAASSGRTGRTGNRGTRTAATATEGKQGEKPVELSEVKEKEKPADVPVILPTMSAEEKKKEQARIRAKKSREKKKAEQQKEQQKDMFNNEQLVTLLVTLSAVLAARPNCGHWQLSQMEAQQIVNPICNIVKANTSVQDLGKYADHIALAIACLTIILPRAIVSVQMYTQERAKKKEVLNNGTNIKAGAITKGNDADGGERDKGQLHNQDDGAGILADLAAAGY